MPTVTSSCACGRVSLEARGAPIVRAVCYCDDCQKGAHQIEALPGAPRILDADGGTDLVLFRKDRVSVAKGEELLKPYKLKDASTTKRVVAACCNSAIYLGFDDSKHWYSMYRKPMRGDLPPVQYRLNTRFKPTADPLPADAPAYRSFPLSFIGKLLGARFAMMFGR